MSTSIQTPVPARVLDVGNERKHRRGKYFISAFVLASFLGGKPPEFGQENTFFHGYLIRNPVVRVALCVNLDEVTLGSSSGVEVYEAGKSYRFLAGDVDSIRIKGRKEALTERFYLQVDQAPNRADADKLAAVLGSRLGPAARVSVVRDDDEGDSYQIRVGEFLTRGEALRYIKTLRAAGLEEAWIVREEVSGERANAVSVMVGDKEEMLDAETVIYFIPTHARSFLSYNGKSYRGIFILRSTKKGLALINVLNLEDYLKGVVPEELSPELFKAFDALKAQAVAARTYAIKHLGTYADLGFDVYDTPRSQVYGGLSAEHSLSNRAVEETWGEVAVYRGRLIDALYTSTCGGSTEDASNVFDGRPEPYLKSTECVYEKQTEWTLDGPQALPVMAGSRNIDRETAWLVGLGLLPGRASSADYEAPAAAEEAAGWIRNAAAFLGKPVDRLAVPAGPLSYPVLAGLLIEAFQWGDRVRNLMLKSEVDFVMRDLPQFHGEARENLAYLIHTGILSAGPALADATYKVTRAELVLALWKSVRSYRDPAREGIFRGLAANGLEVEEGEAVRVLPRAPDCFLFRSLNGEVTRASKLSLLGGEKVRWAEREALVRVLEAEVEDEGNVLDRSSPFHSWQVRQTREELGKRIREYYPIGELVDLDVTARGKSRRVIGLEITGTEGQVVVKGLKVRWVLGLRDTLFALDREFESDGRVSHFVFSGRGWGHGVGLCQVGAYRMAQAGANYRDILKKYYRDVRVSRYY